MTALANAKPVIGAQHPQAQSLQWFLSESTWDAEAVNERRLAVLHEDPTTAGTIGSLQEVADAAGWRGPTDPGAWVRLERSFRDGHSETWWALEVGEKHRDRAPAPSAPFLAGGTASGMDVAGALDHALALLARLVDAAPATTASAAP